MNLDDLKNPMNANTLATLLKKHHGIVIPVNELSESKANKMLARVKKTLSEYAQSKKSHVAEKDRNYTALRLIEQTLNAKLKEAWSVNDEPPKTPMDFAIKIGDKLSGLKRHVPGMSKHDYDAADGPLDVLKKMRGVGVKLQLNDATLDQIDRSVTTRRGVRTIKDLIDDINSGTTLSPADNEYLATIFAKAVSTPYYSAAQINQIAKNNRITAAQLQSDCQLVLSKRANTRVIGRLVRYFVNAQHESITESRRRIYESAMADAEVVLAAKDIADRFQDMVETLGKMVNEELPAITETIRDTMSAEQAQSYNSSATETINSALENIRTAKEALDSAARALAGEEQLSADQSLAPQGQSDEPGSEQLDQIPPSASGAEEEPLGRGER